MWQISRPPCEWCEFGQVFNLNELGDWKTAESWHMLKFFCWNHLKSHLNGPQSYIVTESQSHRVVPLREQLFH